LNTRLTSLMIDLFTANRLIFITGPPFLGCVMKVRGTNTLSAYIPNRAIAMSDRSVRAAQRYPKKTQWTTMAMHRCSIEETVNLSQRCFFQPATACVQSNPKLDPTHIRKDHPRSTSDWMPGRLRRYPQTLVSEL
jgi:hypothetical protein